VLTNTSANTPGGGENVHYENPQEDQAQRDKWQV
jgi:hypothetical protein